MQSYSRIHFGQRVMDVTGSDRRTVKSIEKKWRTAFPSSRTEGSGCAPKGRARVKLAPRLWLGEENPRPAHETNQGIRDRNNQTSDASALMTVMYVS